MIRFRWLRRLFWPLRDRFCKWVIWNAHVPWKFGAHDTDAMVYVVLRSLQVTADNAEHSRNRLRRRIEALEAAAPPADDTDTPIPFELTPEGHRIIQETDDVEGAPV